MLKLESLAKTLSAQVVEALVKLGFSQDDILQGPIEFTNLPWQIPPLVVEAPIFGVPLSEYIDRSVYVNTDALTNLWSEALANMKNHPDKAVTFDGYRAASSAIPGVRKYERQLYLSLPEGFPNHITDLAAIMLSLECAHIMRANSKLQKFVSDESNYYAVLPTGIEVGVKDGLPAMYNDIWDMPAEGMVQEMLRTPRGTPFEGCDYNIIAKVRSIVYTYNKAIKDYEAVDWALQALRVIDGHKELLAAIHSLRRVAHTRDVRMKALNQAVEVVNQLSMTDRQRVETLKNLLVPEVIIASKFSKVIYPFNKLPPPVMSAAALEKVRAAVIELQQLEEALYAAQAKPPRSV